MSLSINRRISVAPMMDWTDRHERYFLRMFSRHILLYSEMVTTGAIIHGNRGRLLRFDPMEHPVAIQLGGSDPAERAEASRAGAEYGYDEVNLNVGCPSARVQTGRFGACLMAEPELVARCVQEMKATVEIPVTVKTRIGIDDRDSYEELATFVRTVAERGCGTFVIHARKAILQGLSPKENRVIPPLNYDYVYRLKQDLPELEIILNGGVTQRDDVRLHLEKVDGVMIGREAYQNPYFLASFDQEFYGDTAPVPTRHEILDRYLSYVAVQLAKDVPLQQMARHILGLFQGVAGARAWRREVTENAHLPGAGVEVLRRAAENIAD